MNRRTFNRLFTGIFAAFGITAHRDTAADQTVPAANLSPNGGRSLVSVFNGDRGYLFDSDGQQIADCISANLATGVCVVFARRDGQLIADHGRGRIVTKTVIHSAPLSFTPFAHGPINS